MKNDEQQYLSQSLHEVTVETELQKECDELRKDVVKLSQEAAKEKAEGLKKNNENLKHLKI